MQTLRKKTSPLKYKNETSRFLGEGVSFKAKLIGILEVSEARGDRMCQEALSDLKMAIRAAGEHKQRITINIAIDGLRLRDEKTGDSLYHHPVHKISFIAQDMTDSRAFGYIFGSPDTGHRFFGIKTDKAASQVVIAMRDLFQVVFALKKKEIELAKQHLDKNRYGSSSIFSDTTITSATKGLIQDTSNKPASDAKSGTTSSDSKVDTPAVADLVDLELELSSLQQGITQMERITPSDPFGGKDDPFGDSFTSYPPKPILPPPPSTRERSSRTSESSSVFSPKTPRTGGSIEGSNAADSVFNSERNFNFTHELSSCHDEPLSGDWFTPIAIDKVFDELSLVPEPSKELQHELAKQEILSQFDVFTELDPLGRSTGKIKPYIDKKDFFQELKNPPKKVLNDLVSEKQPQDTKLFNANFEQLSTTPRLTTTSANGTLTSDPFAEDPFDKTDPFADTEFSRQDPFESENFGAVFNKEVKPVDFTEQFKFPSYHNESISVLNSKLSKSPNKVAALEKQMSLVIGTMRGVQFNKQNTFDDNLSGKILQIHENRSLDMSSESECAPEPPPRPAVNFVQIKPPPLPPKKQPGDLCIKPPPRPPYSEESHYDYMDNYETGNGSVESKKFDKSPPLPAPARKVKLNTEFSTPPQRPKKQFNLQQGWSSEEDYLTPISYPNQAKEPENNTGPILLPPPQRSIKKTQAAQENVTVASLLESKPNIVAPTADQNAAPVEGLDITLSQLTVSGLNEVAAKLNIAASQLSNMTLVQLTEYISNFLKNKAQDANNTAPSFSDFKADFSNFNNFNDEPHDKYAVFRELLEEEIKQTKIDTEPEEHIEERKKEEKLSNLDVNIINEGGDCKTDRYAALREIADTEIKETLQEEESVDENTLNEAEVQDTKVDDDTKLKNETNIINSERILTEHDEVSKDAVIEYNVESKQESAVGVAAVKSPVKIKSPIPGAVNDLIQTNRLTSGSLSDVVSGSSPEIDNTGSTSEVVKNTTDATELPLGESWAIFDQPNLSQQVSRDKHSEEGVSPWSSDSKEFGNGSPPEWRHRTDSGSGAERWACHRREQEGWWDTSAEPEVQYIPTNRRSTDSYEEEGDYYERPPRRRRQMAWTHTGEGGQAAGGHSSSSRDASPWEEEPRRRDLRDHRETWSSRHSRQQHSFDRTRDRRHADSWDEEDDYEYDEEHSGRYHWPERHREVDKDRHTGGMRERDTERWSEDWNETRRYRRKRENDRDRWCCPDWEQDLGDPSVARYSGTRWRDRKHEERYYARESKESPWEEDYANDPEESHSRYLMASKRNWKRPSSASEMDRKTGETKSRIGPYYTGTGGSDSERDRRYKTGRRSKSRDSQFAESQPRHKIDPNLTLRGPYRTKQYLHQKSPLEMEFAHDFPPKKLEPSKGDLGSKRFVMVGNRKKTKEISKTDPLHTFVRKATFENNFTPSETESPVSANISPRFTFENDFETSEPESSVASKPSKSLRHQNLFENTQRTKPRLRYDTRKTKFEEDTRISPSRSTQKSPFEDDFSPPVEKSEAQLHKNLSKSSIKEEIDVNEEDDSFSTNNFDKNTIRKKILNKNRLSSSFHIDSNLKKSESVNIFARESDPFDDEFFCSRNMHELEDVDKSRNPEQKWTEKFEALDFEGRK
ncbi:protein disabled isoform X5 [Photinus pyralis]|uniref:protein disabled isoform X5 n=1 Tax=Photinus pyralis TaxID=7054 RepID=UPI00126705E5|nr:protein disabled isoform X5 [Photinus pyralis]